MIYKLGKFTPTFHMVSASSFGNQIENRLYIMYRKEGREGFYLGVMSGHKGYSRVWVKA